MVHLRRHDRLDLRLYQRIALARERITVTRELLDAVDQSRAAMLAHLAGGGVLAYGVNTGLGYMARHPIEPAGRSWDDRGEQSAGWHDGCWTIWVHEHLHHLAEHQSDLVGPARHVAAIRRRPWWR